MFFVKVEYVSGKVFFTTSAELRTLKKLKSAERLFLLLNKYPPLSISKNKGIVCTMVFLPVAGLHSMARRTVLHPFLLKVWCSLGVGYLKFRTLESSLRGLVKLTVSQPGALTCVLLSKKCFSPLFERSESSARGFL